MEAITSNQVQKENQHQNKKIKSSVLVFFDKVNEKGLI